MASLEAVWRAAVAKRRADEEYRRAITAAIDAGASGAAVAAAAGISRQAARQLALRVRADTSKADTSHTEDAAA